MSKARVNHTITRIVIAEVPSRGKPLFTMKVYDENGHLRSGISTPSSLDYVKKKVDEWFPGVPVEMAPHEGVTKAPRRRRATGLIAEACAEIGVEPILTKGGKVSLAAEACARVSPQ